MKNNEIKFSDSKLFEINKKLNNRPWKYIYKELMPKFLYRKIQKEADFLQQAKVAETWDLMIEKYLNWEISKNYEKHRKCEICETEIISEISEMSENFKSDNNSEIFKIRLLPQKNLEKKKIIWQYWGQGWKYEELPDIVKLCYKSIEKYKGDYTVIRLDNKNLCEYVSFPEFVKEKLKNGNMSYTHFSDLLRLGLLNLYGGVWLDATILLTAPLNDYIGFNSEEKEYFIFQRTDEEKEHKKWEKINSDYFSWDKRNKVKMLSSIIFSEKNNKIIRILLELMLIFWKNENKIPHYFFFQILYTELTDNYLKEEKCKTVSDILPHILFSKWNDEFSEKELNEITDKINIHKLTQKGISKENCISGSFYDYFNKIFEI